ncbi:MAG: SDR family NAD(P)-dependent oxidoreductase [Acidimicrobiales bacterium]|nr:SDR family NAD(P)-dependent oxidoreductase [Acidimicrobiales bacterium]HRW37313.1 SDR family oxidoreductase [Aquihabitans sp.]
MAGLCEGRVAIVTGAGRGIGREHALMLASEGAAVVVNDLGAQPDGSGADPGPANEVVAEIEAMGGHAVVNGANVTDFDESEAMVAQAVETFGRLDILVNNAGILRDRMIFSMSEQEWDDVVAVHLKGHFCPTRHAAAYWRTQSKKGEEVDGRIVNTASPSGLYGNVGQANYGAAKAGIAGFTMVCALELGRIGVTANCLAPTAITRLVAPLMGGEENISDELKDQLSPRWVATVATWLASPQARGVTGRVFDVRGGTIAVSEGWHRGPEGLNPGDPTGAGEVIEELLKRARPNGDLDGRDDPDRF